MCKSLKDDFGNTKNELMHILLFDKDSPIVFMTGVMNDSLIILQGDVCLLIRQGLGLYLMDHRVR